ncbi:MAG: hypothetical protein ACRDOV_13715, partial [Streptomyces sp.]
MGRHNRPSQSTGKHRLWMAAGTVALSGLTTGALATAAEAAPAGGITRSDLDGEGSSDLVVGT